LSGLLTKTSFETISSASQENPGTLHTQNTQTAATEIEEVKDGLGRSATLSRKTKSTTLSRSKSFSSFSGIKNNFKKSENETVDPLLPCESTIEFYPEISLEKPGIQVGAWKFNLQTATNMDHTFPMYIKYKSFHLSYPSKTFILPINSTLTQVKESSSYTAESSLKTGMDLSKYVFTHSIWLKCITVYS
jgi:hypothetical protein